MRLLRDMFRCPGWNAEARLAPSQLLHLEQILSTELIVLKPKPKAG
jgi:hypothetical protein